MLPWHNILKEVDSNSMHNNDKILYSIYMNQYQPYGDTVSLRLKNLNTVVQGLKMLEPFSVPSLFLIKLLYCVQRKFEFYSSMSSFFQILDVSISAKFNYVSTMRRMDF